MTDKKIIPAILTDTLDEFEDLAALIENKADMLQIDYVDGFFAPELTCCEAKLIRGLDLQVPFEVHLMVVDPISQVKDWYKAGATRLVGHIEEMEDQVAFVEEVSKYGIEVGLALNLETPIEDLDEELIPSLDVVLLMAHEVGLQQTPFNPLVLSKIRSLRSQYPSIDIEVDGGLNEKTIKEVADAGANIFAVGSAIFESDDPVKALERLSRMIK